MLRQPRMFLKAVDKLPQTSGLMTRKRNLEIALAFETNFPLKTHKLEKSALETTAHLTATAHLTPAQETIAQERTTRKTTAHERQIEMANTHWRSTSSTSYHSSSQ